MGTRESLLDILYDAIFAFIWVYSKKGCSFIENENYLKSKYTQELEKSLAEHRQTRTRDVDEDPY